MFEYLNKFIFKNHMLPCTHLGSCLSSLGLLSQLYKQLNTILKKQESWRQPATMYHPTTHKDISLYHNKWDLKCPLDLSLDRDSLNVLKHKVICYMYSLCVGTNNHFASSFLQEVKSPSPGLLSISMAAWPAWQSGQGKLRVRKWFPVCRPARKVSILILLRVLAKE